MRPPSMITTNSNDGLPSLKIQNTTNNNNNSNLINNNNQKVLSSESDGRIYTKSQNVEIINYNKYRTNHDNFINNLTKTLSKNHNNIISNPIADLNNRASSSSSSSSSSTLSGETVRIKRISSDINCYNLDTNNSCGSELLDSKNIKNKPLSDYTISASINNNNNNNIIVNKLSEIQGEKIPLLLFKSSTAVNSTTNVITAASTIPNTTATTTSNSFTSIPKQDSIVEFDLKTKNLQNVVVHRNRDHATVRNNKKTTQRNNRRSLQLPIHATSDCNINNNAEHTNYSKRRQQIHSWYAYGYETLFEELEQEKKKIQKQNMSRIPLIHAELEKLAEETSSESGASDDEYTVDLKDNIHYLNNLAGAKNTFTNGTRESASLLENNSNNLVHSSRNRRSNGGNYINTQQQHIQLEGPHAQSLGGPTQPARRKVGQFLKSLVSRKTTKDNSNTTPPLLPQNEQKEEKQQQLPRQQSPTNSLTNLTQTKRVGNSTTSLNIVNQKLWSVVPLFRRETSSSSLNQALKPNHESSLRKCNTVLALTQTAASLSTEPIRPLNRLRNYTSIGTCSRCSSLLSVAAGSKYSLNISNGFVAVSDGETSPILQSSSYEKLINITCKLCLGDVKLENLTKISQCGCSFCTECMTAYVEFEILEGAYEISCPDAMCPSQGILTISEIMLLASNSLIEKHQRYRLNREIELDISRTWCPKAGCETVCLVQTSSEKVVTLQPSSSHLQTPCAVHCPTCEDDFCSGCKKAWHPTMSCEENVRRLAADGLEDDAGIPFDGDLIKCCPMCAVPIEKDEGCAQMMCKRCKHVFCWYCLASLDDDFLLRHYDKGPCKNKLGHSRASVVWHRAQVIGIFAGFGILLLVASPLLLLAAPCIVCCKCRICSGAAKLEENENEFDDVVALQR